MVELSSSPLVDRENSKLRSQPYEEFYHQKLAKALSHDFEAKLLMLDIVNFTVKVMFQIVKFQALIRADFLCVLDWMEPVMLFSFSFMTTNALCDEAAEKSSKAYGYFLISKKLQLDPQKVNVNGGAMAIEHPLGATGNLLYSYNTPSISIHIKVLSIDDPEKHEIHNQYGKDALKEGMGGGGDGHDQSFFGGSLFSGGGGGSSRGRRKQCGEVVVHPLKVSLGDLYNGTSKKLSFTFAAALIANQLDCWVMNVVPVSGPNTLPVIYDRGLLGVMHDWCEPFDTYRRTYDLLHAADNWSEKAIRRKSTGTGRMRYLRKSTILNPPVNSLSVDVYIQRMERIFRMDFRCSFPVCKTLETARNFITKNEDRLATTRSFQSQFAAYKKADQMFADVQKHESWLSIELLTRKRIRGDLCLALLELVFSSSREDSPTPEIKNCRAWASGGNNCNS
ncbi:hypothetical protein M8C21_018982 [Ambrosia artemisiifolia]|uniref:Methyltransferase n=1 Tax=Ambrosia artemisiifolia TaxID=4212 RepID=A0AAD5C4G4_AMBAR|nr:hypothetical protein M8C21_018982 [Ambrosia artemisiifolia]